MPKMSDLIEKRKFVKKEYRPWDLSGSGGVDAKDTHPNQTDQKIKDVVVAKEPVVINEASAIVKNIIEQVQATKTEIAKDLGNISGNTQVTQREHTGNKQVTERKQRDNNKETIREHQNNKTDNIPGNTEDFSYLIEEIKKLTGIQKNIFYFAINLCSARSALDTGNLLTSDLAEACGCSIGSVKTSFLRLIDKKLILRLPGKASKGGHVVLGITNEIQAASIQAQQALFNPFKMNNSGNNKGNNAGNMFAYSSSIYKNNITTSLPEEWKKINFESLQSIGFTETQLKQLFDSNATSPDVVQASINHFSFALEHKEKVKNYPEPLNVLMGVLRKGQSWNEADYVSPQEAALRKILEEKRKRKESMDAMIKELVELEFPAWRKLLSEEEIKKIVSPSSLKVAPALTAELRNYYADKILLPKLEQDGLISKDAL